MQITVGADVVQQLANASANTNDQLWPLIVFAIAIPLAFYLMRRLIGMMPKKSKF
jgi:hypothetical protein